MSEIVLESDERPERALRPRGDHRPLQVSRGARRIKSAEREAVLALASLQALELREDPDDLAEMRAVARDMGTLPHRAMLPREVP